MFRVRGYVCHVVTGVLLIALAGCSGDGEDGVEGAPGSDDGPPSITAEEANRQYHEEAANWDLPVGWTWPEDVYSGEGPDGAPAYYGIHIGQVDATLHWFCAWSRELIATDTAEARQAALTQVLRVTETPFYQIGLVDTAPVDEILVAAEAGDFTKLANFAEQNCPEGPQA